MPDNLNFAGNLATSGVADGLVCVPAEKGKLSSSQKVVPGDSRAQANGVIEALNEAPLTDFETGGALVELGQYTASHVLKVREDYISGLLKIKAIWEDAEAKGRVTPELAKELSDLREQTRLRSRQNSKIGVWVYDVIDKYNAKPDRGAEIATKLLDGRYAEVARSSFKNNQKWTSGIRISERAFRALNRVNNVATLVSIGLPAAKVFSANSQAEELNALRDFYKASFGAAVGLAGNAGGAFLCTSFGLSSAGFGFLSCGVLVGGAGVAGGALGEKIGQEVFSVLGTANLTILKYVKQGPAKPSVQ